MRLDFILFSRTVAVGALLVSGPGSCHFGPASAVGAVGSKAFPSFSIGHAGEATLSVNVSGGGFNGPSGIALGRHPRPGWRTMRNSVTELSGPRPVPC